MIMLSCINSDEELEANYLANRAYKVPYISKLKQGARKLKRKAVICAGGPSLADFVNNLRSSDGDIFAIKNADYLLDNGVTPRYEVHVDAQLAELDLVSKDTKVTYLVSNQSNPEMFEHLKGRKVYEFNNRSSSTWQPKDRPVISAGSNVTAHAIYLALWLGYKEIEIYGFDCGRIETRDSSHITRDEGLSAANLLITQKETGKKYLTNDQMLGMAQEALQIVKMAANLVDSITVHGDGLLTHLIQVDQHNETVMAA